MFLIIHTGRPYFRMIFHHRTLQTISTIVLLSLLLLAFGTAGAEADVDTASQGVCISLAMSHCTRSLHLTHPAYAASSDTQVPRVKIVGGYAPSKIQVVTTKVPPAKLNDFPPRPTLPLPSRPNVKIDFRSKYLNFSNGSNSKTWLIKYLSDISCVTTKTVGAFNDVYKSLKDSCPHQLAFLQAVSDGLCS